MALCRRISAFGYNFLNIVIFLLVNFDRSRSLKVVLLLADHFSVMFFVKCFGYRTAKVGICELRWPILLPSFLFFLSDSILQISLSFVATYLGHPKTITGFCFSPARRRNVSAQLAEFAWMARTFQEFAVLAPVDLATYAG